MIPCRNIAALSAAQAEASARGGPPQGRAPQTSARSYDNNRSSRHPLDDGTEFLILILKLPIAGCFCTRLAHFAEDEPPLRQAAPRQNPNKFGSALGLHYLCPMTEFELIARIGQLFAGVPRNGFEKPGDDCTVLGISGSESLLFTADLLTEGIHFLRNTTPPYELGRKALAVNLSDVAAMGGRSVATLLSVALPPDVSDEWTEAFLRGYRDLSAEEGVMLAGGDTTSSRHDITVNVTVVGRTADHCIKRRSDARAGDAIVVAGVLGASGAGLRDLLAGNLDTPNARIHNAPVAQTAEGLWLGERTEVHAMTDLSDGLASDLRHIAEQSHVGATVDLERIPIAPGSDLVTALTGGEDYKLLFTAAPEALPALCRAFESRFGRPLYPIGTVTKAEDDTIVWLDCGRRVETDWRGYEHNA